MDPRVGLDHCSSNIATNGNIAVVALVGACGSSSDISQESVLGPTLLSLLVHL